MLIFLTLFPKTEEGTLPNSFYNATITEIKAIPRYHKKMKLHFNIFMNIDIKILNKTCQLNSATQQKVYIPGPSIIYPRNARMVEHRQANQCVTLHS